MKLRALIAAVLLAVLATTAGAEKRGLNELRVQMVPFRLGCMNSTSELLALMWRKWGELPSFVMELAPEFTGYILTNDDNTSLSWIVVKHSATGDDACLVWAGESKSGMAIVAVSKPDRSTLPPRDPPGENM